ncbi:MAG: DUF1304 domain-containing protein [Saprospiraceae bacterium]
MISYLIQFLIAFIILEHFYFLYLEMIAWETAGKKAFKGVLKDELFKPTKGLAANQGLYNGFLACGLLWSFFIKDVEWSNNIRTFFLTCISIAGIFGGITASKKIFFIQALPALISLIILVLFKS